MSTSKKKYVYKAGRSAPVPAQVVGESLAAIEARDGGVTPRAVVEEARPDEAALHPCFEWDDAVAAELHREDQARRLVNVVRVESASTRTGESQRQVAWISVLRPDPDGGAKRSYVAAAAVLSDAELRLQALGECHRQLQAWRQRFQHLQDLAEALAGAEAAVAATLAKT